MTVGEHESILHPQAAGSLREQVYEKIESDILNGKYRIGDSLTENALAVELGVSRTPIREALRQLEQDGLVEFVPNRGAIVSGIEPQDIEDIYLIKQSIEALAGRLAAERINADELSELEEVMALTEYYVKKQDFDRLVLMDSRFHSIIFNASRNKPLGHVLSNFHSFVKKARNESLHMPGRTDKMLCEHRDIYLAIADHDPDRAEKSMGLHINNAMKSLLEAAKTADGRQG